LCFAGPLIQGADVRREPVEVDLSPDAQSLPECDLARRTLRITIII
jgi:hypothetical protein